MKKLVDLVKISYLDSLIRRKCTGSPIELANKLGISRSGLFNLLAFLREEMQAPIQYNKDRISYYYEYNPKFYLGFEKDRINSKEMETVWAGEEENKEIDDIIDDIYKKSII